MGKKLPESERKPGEILRRIRRSVGMNQQTLAGFCGISRRRYNQIETGNVRPYAHEWMRAIDEMGYELVVLSNDHSLLRFIREKKENQDEDADE